MSQIPITSGPLGHNNHSATCPYYYSLTINLLEANFFFISRTEPCRQRQLLFSMSKATTFRIHMGVHSRPYRLRGHSPGHHRSIWSLCFHYPLQGTRCFDAAPPITPHSGRPTNPYNHPKIRIWSIITVAF